MKRASKIALKGSVERQAEAVRLVPQPGDVALVERGVLRSLVMRCPDGCGDVLTINLDIRSGKAWRLYRNPRGELTLYPSVWRDTGCEAHFILWRDKVLWGRGDERGAWSDSELRQHVLEQLPPSGNQPIHFEEIAARLAEPPWEVLWECRSLVRSRLAVMSEDERHFAAASPEYMGDQDDV
ncbi:MAG: DUF6527 family protein [Bauldia sp.]